MNPTKSYPSTFLRSTPTDYAVTSSDSITATASQFTTPKFIALSLPSPPAQTSPNQPQPPCIHRCRHLRVPSPSGSTSFESSTATSSEINTTSSKSHHCHQLQDLHSNQL
eukprot:CAMPEP_0172166162 /NCGR_PEP_ID=MMETSP1050-20130122/8826_1 /TAXON_ID=233186 /ORGANISM="Cryptomonas curvata, Strain CCAP979/52" /LENGTH=109 /DNA_ID=CAMNT_0012836737 /DNA_START=39 /DNA_END=368 /DNA_ORIENTATION=-